MPLSRVNPFHDIIDLEEEPLSKRSWALQERYLSPRTLHFASTQMYFECRSDFSPQDRHLEQDTGMDFKIHKRATAKDNNPADSWKDIVRRYTQRYLTVESDKLPAIGGLAERVFLERGLDNSPQDEYLAGLWRKDLLVDLVWKTFAEDPKRSSPTSYTAPSWSWASVNEPAMFMGNENTQSLAVIQGAKVDLESSESPFGKVTGGWVHLACMKLHPWDVDERGGIYICEGDPFFHISAHMDSTRFNLPEVCVTDYMDKKSELVVVPLTLIEGDEDGDEDDDMVAAAQFLLLVSSTSGQGPIGDLPRFRRVGVGFSFIEKSDGYGGDAMRRLRDRCMEAMEQKTLEDIIIV
ncbi:heterokaryon incompatibility protein [Fusarium flagelliforme]|uniref:Heterokaryon incompatibility protein n=2 Tax=Fusarium flagelliforme TaxID=2675880 RepID=A0A395N2E2_9HYPO|nr:heterokaryon incompatibility protein [Fusarium flagelliforme]